ncbi:hypothetical protein CEXT_40251 [Caerostris extrusa]|uniref:Uncharacterized protein n=1 Tax=Caerostris extrusa TaxID=172846 RepID=A0AAV4UNI5_CAEEX|nr:hypothetical protein CEXT_40251 [Caerostris extrusa]
MEYRVPELGLIIIKLTVAVNREFHGKLLPRGVCLMFYHKHTPATVINSRVCLSWSLKCRARGTREVMAALCCPSDGIICQAGVAKPAQSAISGQALLPICLVNNSAWGKDVIFIAFRMAWNMSYRES